MAWFDGSLHFYYIINEALGFVFVDMSLSGSKSTPPTTLHQLIKVCDLSCHLNEQLHWHTFWITVVHLQLILIIISPIALRI